MKLRDRVAFHFARLDKGLRTGYWHTGERVCPDYPDANFANHLKVYLFLRQFVRSKNVLDIGCGTGYGAQSLAESAASVTAVDYSRHALAYAKRFHPHQRLLYLPMDADNLLFPAASFDFVMSSEVFEHIHHPKKHLSQIASIVRPDGLCFIATPNPEMTDGVNKFHTKEWPYLELHAAVSAHFRNTIIIETMGRRPVADRGINPLVRFSVRGAEVDRAHLHNSHSFFVFAWH